MNAVHRARVDRFLNKFVRVAVLLYNARSSIVRLNVERVSRYMSTVLTADARNLIDVYAFLPESATQLRLQTRSF
jgi:hypothetical protein